MTNSESFQIVERYFDEFRRGVVRCRDALTFDAADWKDAYTRLSRLRDRYLEEKKNLTPAELEALSKVFEEDAFTKGMLEIRQVGEHVRRRDSFVVRLTTREPITLPIEVSAMPMFNNKTPTLVDIHGQHRRLDHLKMLEEMERTIERTLAKVSG